MKKLRKFLNASVMVMTILAMSGLGMFTPNFANAAASAGDLIKMEGNSSVYYFDGAKRFVFPNEATYFSWYSDFSGVVTIPSSELQSYLLGGNVVMRPGTKLVKITTDPKVYAVEANGVLRHVQTEAQAIALYGTDWAKRVVDVPDAFFTNYSIGTPLASGNVPAGSLVKNAGSASVYYYDGTNYRSIASEAAMTANRLSFSNVLTITNPITAGGTAITGMETAIVKTSQGGATGPVITGSGLMVSLNSSTPASMSIPKNASRVNFATVNLTAANDGSVSLNSLTIKRIGLSDYEMIERVWAEKDGVEITSKKSMNSNNESILTFSPALVIPAGQTVAIDVLASLKLAGGNIGLSIAAASAVSATAASVSGSFPISGNLMSPTTYEVANVTVTQSGAGTASPSIGEENIELAAFELGTNKDVLVKTITLKNNGVEDLSTAAMNLHLESAGTKVSERTVVDGRFVTFYLGDMEISKDNASKILKVKGDIISKENTATSSFSFVINKSTDISVFEKATGFGANVLSGGVSISNLAIGTVSIASGIVTVSKDATSPSNFSMIKGADKTALIAKIKTDEAIVADGLNINYTGSDVDSFENIRVYLNGILLDSFDFASTNLDADTKDIDTSLNLNAGDNKVEIKVRAKSTATSSANVMFSLDNDIFDAMNPEYSVSGNLVADNEITGDATGATVTVEGATLQTVRNDGYGLNKTIVAGSSDVSLGKFVVDADNDDVTITSVYLSANNADGAKTENSTLSGMKLYVNGDEVKTANFGTSGSTFSSLNIVVDKDEASNIEIKGSFNTSAKNHFRTTMTLNVIDSRGQAVNTDNVATSTTFLLTDAGSLEITDSGEAPTSGLLASKAGVEQSVAQFKFTAVNDEVNIKEINVINWDGTGTLASTTAATSSADARIASVRLYDGSTLLSSFVPVLGAGKFTISGDKLRIAANTNKTLTVKVVLNDIFNDNSATNKELNIAVTTLKYNTSAGSEVTQGVAKAGEEFIIRKTIPTIAYQTLPERLISSDDMVIAKFTVAADSNGDMELNKVVLNVSTSASTSIATTTNSLKVNGSNKVVTASYTGSNLTIDFGSNNEVISAGTSKTFEVIAEVTTNGENGEYVRTKIVEDDSFEDDGNFVWSDGSHITTETYANGYLVKGLTTDNWTITK